MNPQARARISASAAVTDRGWLAWTTTFSDMVAGSFTRCPRPYRRAALTGTPLLAPELLRQVLPQIDRVRAGDALAHELLLAPERRGCIDAEPTPVVAMRIAVEA